MKNIQIRARAAKLMTWKTVVAIGVAALAINLSVVDLQVSGALRGTFPNTQVFSVGVAYSFANSQGSVLLPGSTANVTLTINSAISTPTTLFLAFNASDQADWGFNTPAQGPCYNAHPLSLQMSFGTNIILPINSALAASLAGTCPNGTFGQTATYPTSYQVTVVQGVNNYYATITVSANTQLATTFSLSWTASQ